MGSTGDKRSNNAKRKPSSWKAVSLWKAEGRQRLRTFAAFCNLPNHWAFPKGSLPKTEKPSNWSWRLFYEWLLNIYQDVNHSLYRVYMKSITNVQPIHLSQIYKVLNQSWKSKQKRWWNAESKSSSSLCRFRSSFKKLRPMRKLQHAAKVSVAAEAKAPCTKPALHLTISSLYELFSKP